MPFAYLFVQVIFPSFGERYLSTSMFDTLRHEVENIGFDWGDLINPQKSFHCFSFNVCQLFGVVAVDLALLLDKFLDSETRNNHIKLMLLL